MIKEKYYDVLIINDIGNNADIIQALMGSDCLGTYIENNTTKFYFNPGIRGKVENTLYQISADSPIDVLWKKQIKKNWHLMWQDGFRPISIGNKLAIIPCWNKDYKADVIIKIKPGMAFGTGHHETTWLILKQMLKYIKPNFTVLDLGTGSGILSIAAKKLGAQRIDAIDDDLECKRNFQENFKINNVNKNVYFHNTDILTWDKWEYDLIFANINLHIIRKLILNINKTEATIILSGLLEINFVEVKMLLSKHRFNIIEKETKGEWVCLIIKKQINK